MKAMRLVEFGDPPAFELHEVADEPPGRGEVTIALRAASLNRRDPWVWRTPGYCPLPVTLGSDGAGTVLEVGAEVARPVVGDEVVIYPTLGWEDGATTPGDDFDILGAPTDGTFAERIRVAATSTYPRPQRLSWQESAALPLAGLTAFRAMFTCGGVEPGTKVLVTGAGSGVATFLVQLAVAAGAEVAVTTGSAEKAARCRDLGAAAAVLYGDERWPEELAKAVGPLDVVVDSFGADSFSRALPLLRRGGTFVSFGDTGGASAALPVAEVYWEWRTIVGTSMGSPGEFRELLAHVEAASWHPVIDSAFSLEQLPLAAERLFSPDRFGKVVLDISRPVDG
ncbi:MAG: zinc-binding dehydrogenase [Acidimicrobiales bacterium]|jgi:NADPH:quinone reductase-like Zn-dependent oxidoreductase